MLRIFEDVNWSRCNLMNSYDENTGWFEDVNWSRINQMNSYDENTGCF